LNGRQKYYFVISEKANKVIEMKLVIERSLI